MSPSGVTLLYAFPWVVGLNFLKFHRKEVWDAQEGQQEGPLSPAIPELVLQLLKTLLEHLRHPFIAFRDLLGIRHFPSPSVQGVTPGEVKHPRTCQKGRKAAGKSELCCNMKIKCKARGVFLAGLGCTGV